MFELLARIWCAAQTNVFICSGSSEIIWLEKSLALCDAGSDSEPVSMNSRKGQSQEKRKHFVMLKCAMRKIKDDAIAFQHQVDEAQAKRCCTTVFVESDQGVIVMIISVHQHSPRLGR